MNPARSRVALPAWVLIEPHLPANKSRPTHALAPACAGSGGQLRLVAVRSPGVRGSTRLAMDAGNAMPVCAGGSRGTRCALQRVHRVLCFARVCAP